MFFLSPFLKKNILITVSVILFAFLLFSLNNLVPFLGRYIQHLEFIAIGLMIAMSLVIMFLWSMLGAFGGLASFLIAMIFLYESFTALDSYYYSVLFMSFFASSSIGHYFSRKIGESNRKYKLTVENIWEHSNLVKNHMEKRKAEISAMNYKINSLLKIKNIADKLSFSLSLQEIINIFLSETSSIFKEENRVIVYMLDDNYKSLNLACISKNNERKDLFSKEGDIFDKWVIKNKKSLLIKDIRKDFRFSIEDDVVDDTVSLMIKPLMVEEDVVGLLRIDSTNKSEFSQYELRILDIIGGLIAVSLRNANLYKQTEELATKDSLTGLYVYRYFMEILNKEIQRTKKEDNASFALIILDIDNFKQFNDKHGHISGDSVLRNIGRILNKKLSVGDVVSRYGGEEFIFLVANCDREKAILVANSIRIEIEDSPIILRREKCVITVSIGVAVFPEDADTSEKLIAIADKYLYEAKSKGKNLVCSK